MNIYPIFELEKVFLTKGYQYALVNRKAIYYSWGAPTRHAEHGDILLVDNDYDFWVCALKNGEFWEKYPFEELPPEYKAWLLLVGI